MRGLWDRAELAAGSQIEEGVARASGAPGCLVGKLGMDLAPDWGGGKIEEEDQVKFGGGRWD